MADDASKAELKEDLKRLRKKPMPFAFGLKDAQNRVLLLHKSKSPRSLANDARSKEGAKTVTFGRASAEGKVLTLIVEGPPLAGLDKKVRVFLRDEQLTLYTEVIVIHAAASPASGGGADQAEMSAAIRSYPLEPKQAQHPVDAEQNAQLARLTPEQLRGEDLTQRNTKELFTEDYMGGLVGLKMPGANDPKLKEVMRRLERGLSGKDLEEQLALLSRILNQGGDKTTTRQLAADYGRFLILQKQQAAVGKQNATESVPALAEDLHGEFMGSNPQLVFGKVVGDAFGIHPVFGALLSPTGGMVGPGNMALHLDDDDPTGYHGIVHDAAGYLFNYHDQEPGYNYLGREARPTDDPLTGQQSGMRYWHEKLNPGVGTEVLTGTIDVVYAAKDGIGEAAQLYEAGVKSAEQLKVDVEKRLEQARDDVEQAFDAAMTYAEERKRELETEAEQAARDMADAARRKADEVEKSAIEAYRDTTDALGTVADAAGKKLEAAWSYLFD